MFQNAPGLGDKHLVSHMLRFYIEEIKAFSYAVIFREFLVIRFKPGHSRSEFAFETSCKGLEKTIEQSHTVHGRNCYIAVAHNLVNRDFKNSSDLPSIEDKARHF